MNAITIRRRITISLTEAQRAKVARWINVQHVGDEEVNELRAGRLVGKYPEAEPALSGAHWRLGRSCQVELDLSYDKNGCLVDVQWVKPAEPKTLAQVFSEEK